MAERKGGAELALQEPILAALSRKIIRILLRIAAVPARFFVRVLELSIEHRRIAGCDLLPVRPSFPASGFATFTEDIAISLRRALADATPSLTA